MSFYFRTERPPIVLETFDVTDPEEVAALITFKGQKLLLSLEAFEALLDCHADYLEHKIMKQLEKKDDV